MLANRLKLFWALLGNQLWVRPTLWSLLSVAAVAVALHFGNSLMADGAPEVDVDTLSSMLTVIASTMLAILIRAVLGVFVCQRSCLAPSDAGDHQRSQGA